VAYGVEPKAMVESALALSHLNELEPIEWKLKANIHPDLGGSTSNSLWSGKQAIA